MNIITYAVTVTTTGGAGAATGTATSETIVGELVDIYLDFHASAPATTDTTIASTNAQQGTIMTKANSATDALFTPMRLATDAAGASIAGVYRPWFLNAPVTVSLAQCDALTGAVVAYIRVARY